MSMFEAADDMVPGFAEPVHDSQQAFRAVLGAMSQPGRIFRLSQAPAAPAPLAPVAAAVLLSLVDMDTPLWLDPPARREAVAGWLRFHCGCPLVEEPRAARFALFTDPASMPPLEAFDRGHDSFPDRSATLVLQVESLDNDAGPVLAGPGIRGQARLGFAPQPPGFIEAFRANHALYPRGVDLVLAASDRLAALPRSVRMGDRPCT